MTHAAGTDTAVAGLPDYHTHSARCGHAVGSAADYVEAALRLGLGALGVSDHLPLLHVTDPELTMSLEQLPEYVAEILELKARYPGFVLLGVEADYHPSTLERVKGLLDAYPFDYAIGSVHFLGEWGFDDPRNLDGFAQRDLDALYRAYFELVAEAAASGAFTILGHVDLVKKFGHRPTVSLDGALEALAEHVSRSGTVVEINTAGLHKPVGEVYPSPEILAALCRHGVPITFGSDAHAPGEVGRDLATAVRVARAAGYTCYAALEPADRTSLPGERVESSARRPARVVQRSLPPSGAT